MLRKLEECKFLFDLFLFVLISVVCIELPFPFFFLVSRTSW